VGSSEYGDEDRVCIKKGGIYSLPEGLLLSQGGLVRRVT
jgi:hypothetical protein